MSLTPPNDDHQQALLELRTLQKVAWELSRSLDLDVVLGRCLDLAMEAAHAAAGNIYLHDAAHAVFRRTVGRGVDDDVAPEELPADTMMKVLTTSSLQIEVKLEEQDSPRRAAAWQRGLRRALLLVLHIDGADGGEQVGFLSLLFHESVPLPASTLQTLEAIARHEAMAIANARAHQLVERKSRLGDGLRVFSERALGCQDPADLYRLILDSAQELTGNRRGIISRVAGGTAKIVAASSDNVDLLGVESPLTAPYLDEVIASRVPVLCEDTASVDPQSEMGRTLALKGTRSYMTVAVRHGERPVGILYVSSTEPRRYQPEEIEALQILATLAGEALERVNVLERLAEEKRRLDAVLEHLPISVSVIGKNGERFHLNAAARAFLEEFGGDDDGWHASIERMQTLHPDGRAVARDELPIFRAFNGEAPPPQEYLLVSPEGRKRHVMTVAAPLFGPDGRVEAVVAGSQNVDALRELADAKDRFLRIASHELRSPLTALRATTSLLEMDPSAIADPERRTLMLERIHRQVERLTRLVEQLIDSARLNAAEPPLDRAPTDVAALCREVIASLPYAERVKLEAPSPVVGQWDASRLEQVVSNLLSNAARYSLPHSEIVVCVSVDGAGARVEVSDRGIGIPPEQEEKLFTPFFRASNAAAQSKGGMGLGLHIAHEIVRRHGGRLGVRSKLGEGSTFIVELPLAD